VLDFGISKTNHAARRDKVLTGQSVLGSPAYMSPEQLRNASNIDARADLWSLGVVLYELVTGKLPFDADSVGEIFAAILEKDPVDIRTHRPDIPEGLADVIMTSLERDPDHRFLTAIEFAHALVPYVTSRLQDCPWELERLFSTQGIPMPQSVRSVRALTKAVRSEPRSVNDVPGASVPVRDRALSSMSPLGRGALALAGISLGLFATMTVVVWLSAQGATAHFERPPLRHAFVYGTAAAPALLTLAEPEEPPPPTTKTSVKVVPRRGAVTVTKAGRPTFLKSSD
jgi:serine/threonine-protein kinase